MVVTPSSNLLDQQTVSVAITSDVTNGHFYAVTQCGNATSAGAPVTPGNAADCAGQADIPTYITLVSDSGTGLAAAGGGLQTGTVYTVNLKLKKTGIGTNNAQCLPVGGAITSPCIVTVAEADALQNTYGQVAVPITYRPAATVSITAVTGQTGTQAARAGNTLSIAGGNWDAGGTLTAELCATDLTGCEATVTGTATTPGGSISSAGLTVAPGATSGARALKVTDGVQTASTPVTILGTRVLTLSPAAGGVGTAVTVTGSGFDASKTVAISATDGVNGLGIPTITASSATGAVSGVVTIADLATIGIGAQELDGVGAPIPGAFGFAPFSASGNTCDGTGCTVLQTVTLVVNPGVLNITQADNQVTMAPVQLDGTQLSSTGSLADVTITDARGSLVGWSVTATMSDLTLSGGGTNSTIVASNMTLTPTCAPSSATTGSSTGITAGGLAQAFGGANPVSLCTAAVGQGGGTYAVDGGLSLVIPATIRSGSYTSTITVLLT